MSPVKITVHREKGLTFFDFWRLLKRILAMMKFFWQDILQDIVADRFR